MTNLTVGTLYLLTLALLVTMLVQGLRRSVELLSMRNLYLGGFIVYQLLNPATMLVTDNVPMFRLNRKEQAGSVLLLYAIVFLAVFFFAYHKTFVWKRLARLFKGRQTMQSDIVLLVVAVCLLVVATGSRLMPNVPVLSSVVYHLSIGFAAVASGLAGWYWARHRGNVLTGVVVAMVFLGGVGLVLAGGAFGRRSLLVVGIGLAWGVYYSLAKKLKPIWVLSWSAPLLIVAVVFISAFSAIRGQLRSNQLSAAELARAMVGARVQEGAKDVFGGQTCGAASLWCIENYPKNHEYRHLFSLRQMVNQFVPRFLWPEKPKPLANHLARLANVPGVNQGKITLPPGVLGYAAAEGGLYAVVVYALFFGGFTRWFDEIVRLNSDDPFFVIVCSSVTGHMLGLARGDLANFTINAIVTFFATLVFVWLIRKFVGKPIQQRFYYRPVADPRGAP